MKGAIVLCSGGLDSVVTAHHVKKLGYDEIKILFFDYGQKSLKAERKSSKKCAKNLKADFLEIRLPLGSFSNSLINKSGKVKTMRKEDLKDSSEESKKWYVPFRNTIFLSYALAASEFSGKNFDIFVGFKNEGKESYPDTTEEYVDAINRLQKIAGGKSKIIAPLIKKDKEDIVLLGKKLGINLGETFSCYTGNKHCGRCLACALRKAGFYWANVKDDTNYIKK